MFGLHRIFQALRVISAKQDNIIRTQVQIGRSLVNQSRKIDKLQESVDNLSKPNMATRLEIKPD